MNFSLDFRGGWVVWEKRISDWLCMHSLYPQDNLVWWKVFSSNISGKASLWWCGLVEIEQQELKVVAQQCLDEHWIEMCAGKRSFFFSARSNPLSKEKCFFSARSNPLSKEKCLWPPPPLPLCYRSHRLLFTVLQGRCVPHPPIMKWFALEQRGILIPRA